MSKVNNCVVLLQLPHLADLLPVLRGGDLGQSVCLGHLDTIICKLIVSDGTGTKLRDNQLPYILHSLCLTRGLPQFVTKTS